MEMSVDITVEYEAKLFDLDGTLLTTNPHVRFFGAGYDIFTAVPINGTIAGGAAWALWRLRPWAEGEPTPPIDPTTHRFTFINCIVNGPIAVVTSATTVAIPFNYGDSVYLDIKTTNEEQAPISYLITDSDGINALAEIVLGSYPVGTSALVAMIGELGGASPPTILFVPYYGVWSVPNTGLPTPSREELPVPATLLPSIVIITTNVLICNVAPTATRVQLQLSGYGIQTRLSPLTAYQDCNVFPVPVSLFPADLQFTSKARLTLVDESGQTLYESAVPAEMYMTGYDGFVATWDGTTSSTAWQLVPFTPAQTWQALDRSGFRLFLLDAIVGDDVRVVESNATTRFGDNQATDFAAETQSYIQYTLQKASDLTTILCAQQVNINLPAGTVALLALTGIIGSSTYPPTIFEYTGYGLNSDTYVPTAANAIVLPVPGSTPFVVNADGSCTPGTPPVLPSATSSTAASPPVVQTSSTAVTRASTAAASSATPVTPSNPTATTGIPSPSNTATIASASSSTGTKPGGGVNTAQGRYLLNAFNVIGCMVVTILTFITMS